ncbi:hypothetical protein SDC9_83358 [bioreactor metagenome]|uniref:Uncharacterized protein n=1 Tax=bioreactor metagenome TaxID=1076179 RepID=A0A644Z7D4_9ZZZZ
MEQLPHAGVHILHAGVFQSAVVISAADSQVGAGKPPVGESGAIRPAADRAAEGLSARRAHRVVGRVDEVPVGKDFFLHVPVTVLYGNVHRVRTVFSVHLLRQAGKVCLAFGELDRVVIPDVAGELRLFHRAADLLREVVALVELGGLGTLSGRHAVNELRGHQNGVSHDVFSRAGMHADALERDLRRGRVEGFVLHRAEGVAVQGVGEVRPQLFKIQQVGAPADFLVGGKAELHRAPGKAAVF